MKKGFWHTVQVEHDGRKDEEEVSRMDVTDILSVPRSLAHIKRKGQRICYPDQRRSKIIQCFYLFNVFFLSLCFFDPELNL